MLLFFFLREVFILFTLTTFLIVVGTARLILIWVNRLVCFSYLLEVFSDSSKLGKSISNCNTFLFLHSTSFIFFSLTSKVFHEIVLLNGNYWLLARINLRLLVELGLCSSCYLRNWNLNFWLILWCWFPLERLRRCSYRHAVVDQLSKTQIF